MDALTRMGCIVCRIHKGIYTPAGIHHCTYLGKRDHMRTIPLCPPHHQTGGPGVARHPYGRRWEQEYGTEGELLEATNRMLEVTA